MMVSLYGWLTQEKWCGKRSHYDGWPTPNGKNVKCGLIIMGDLPKWKIEKMWSDRVIMGDLPRGSILSKLHAFLRNSFNTRSLLATFLDECRSTRSFLAISNNLESHRAIPFTKAKTWSSFWRPSSKYKIPSGDLLYPNNLESHLAIPYNQHVIWGPI